MADSTPPPDDDGPPLRHDPGELRRLIALSFRAGELAKFASKVGVFTDQEGTPEAGARILVRAMEHREAVPDLVARLAEAKPDVEWPEPSLPALPKKKAEPPPAPAPDALADPFGDASDDDGDAPPSQRGGGGRALAIVGALLALVGLVALGVAWRVSQRAAQEESAKGRAQPAGRAAHHLAQAVGALARACDAEANAADARSALTQAFRRCALRTPMPGKAAAPMPWPDPVAPVPAPGVRPRPTPRPAPALGGRESCLARCENTHRVCQRDRCGSEPLPGAGFEAYQRCMSGCLATSSRCRLTCP